MELRTRACVGSGLVSGGKRRALGWQVYRVRGRRSRRKGGAVRCCAVRRAPRADYAVRGDQEKWGMNADGWRWDRMGCVGRSAVRGTLRGCGSDYHHEKSPLCSPLSPLSSPFGADGDRLSLLVWSKKIQAFASPTWAIIRRGLHEVRLRTGIGSSSSTVGNDMSETRSRSNIYSVKLGR